MKDIVTKLCCCAMFAACYAGNAEGMQNQLQMSEPLPTIQNAVEFISSIDSYSLSLNNLVQAFLNGNRQLEDDTREQLENLRNLANDIFKTYVPSLNETLKNAGANLPNEGSCAGYSREITKDETLELSRRYLTGMQTKLNALEESVQGLPQEILATVNRQADNIQQCLNSMNATIESLQQLMVQ